MYLVYLVSARRAKQTIIMVEVFDKKELLYREVCLSTKSQVEYMYLEILLSLLRNKLTDKHKELIVYTTKNFAARADEIFTMETIPYNNKIWRQVYSELKKFSFLPIFLSHSEKVAYMIKKIEDGELTVD